MEFVVHPLLPGVTGQVLFSLVMISLMYCSVPGTWYQPIFTTCYALTMASMTMRGTDAILLRILYLCAAVVIVFAANRFFLPLMDVTSSFPGRVAPLKKGYASPRRAVKVQRRRRSFSSASPTVCAQAAARTAIFPSATTA